MSLRPILAALFLGSSPAQKGPLPAPRWELRTLNQERRVVDPLSQGLHWSLQGDCLLGSPQRGSLEARRLPDNRLLWKTKLQGEASCPLSIRGEHLFLVTDEAWAYKINWKKGEILWEKHLNSRALRRIFLEEKSLFVATTDDGIYKLDSSTGRILWYQNPGEDFHSSQPEVESHCPLVGTASHIIHGRQSGEIFAFHRQSGEILWRHEASEKIKHKSIQGSHILGKQLFYVRAQGQIGHLELESGKALWEKQLPLEGCSQVLFQGEKAYVGGSTGELLALSQLEQGGISFWKQKLKGTLLGLYLRGSHLYASTADGYLYLLDAHKGQILWQDFLGTRLSQEPLSWRGKLYFPSASKRLYGYLELAQRG